MTRALRLYAGPAALEHLRREGLQPQHVGIVPGAAGGPKGLILGPLDRWLFGHWLPQGGHGVHLIGASIGAWRMAAACLHDAVAAFERLRRDYIAQDYELEPGQQRPSARQVSAAFARDLQAFFGGRVHEVLYHPRWRVHIVTSRGRHVLAREGRWRTPLGYVAFHGGGFVVGSVRTHAALCRHLAHLSGCAVLSLDYRLAPEHRFPTAVNDAFDALAWLRGGAAGLGLDPARIAVGGDSAGGTLAAVTALQARDAGWPLALQLLFYPGCSAWQKTPSHRRFAHGFVLEAETIQWFFRHYIDDAQREDWRFAPLLAPDFDGAAPAWIGLAECDPLVDEGVLLADRLRMDRVEVQLEIYHGVTHEFIKMARVIPQALHAHEDAARALRHAMGNTRP